MGLFSTTHHHHSRTEHHTKLVPFEKTVHEHKAPTDDSIKLLNEMQQKAKDNVIKTLRIEENHLKAVIMFSRSDILTDRIEYVIKFILNGKEYIVKDHITGDERWELNIGNHYDRDQRYIKLLYKKFSEVITMELFNAHKSELQKSLNS